MPTSVEHWQTRIGRRIRLRDLHVLLTVVQCGSMAKAASRLGVSQPAISKAIADLEHTLHVRLLDRSPRGVEPTLYGRMLVRRGLAVFDELRQGVGEIEFTADPTVGEVRIGCPESVTATLLPAVIERLCDRYPGLVLHVAQVNPTTLEIRELRDRNVDLLIGRMASSIVDEDLHAEILFHERLIVVAGTQSEWARRHKIELADLIHGKWILFPPHQVPTLVVDEAFRAQGLDPPRPSVTTYSFYLREMLLTTHDYLSAVPASMLRAFNSRGVAVKALPVDLGVNSRPMAMFTLKNRTLSPAVELFIESVRTVGKSMAEQFKR
jgi:DNA-binding transcriptional LysR family regulator